MTFKTAFIGSFISVFLFVLFVHDLEFIIPISDNTFKMIFSW